MAKVKSKLDEIFESAFNSGFEAGFSAGEEDETYNLTQVLRNGKQYIKALFLEIQLAAHDEAGSEAEAIKLFEKKVKEL